MASKANLPEDSDPSLLRTTTRTASISDDTDIEESLALSFVDYTPHPEAKVLPPAKYKLWLIIFVLVYFANWVSGEAEFIDFIQFDGWLSPEASLFLRLAVVVFVLVYSTLDLVIALFTVKTKKGKEYGIGPWLKQPRIVFFYHHENIVFEIMARIVHVLEDGFSMFDAPPSPTKATLDPPSFDCPNKSCVTTLRIEHHINPDKIDDYRKWVARIQNAVKEQNGLLGVEAKKIQREWDEEQGKVKVAEEDPSTEEESQPPVTIHVVYAKFKHIDYLNSWLFSPRRKALMKALKPLLVEPDVLQIQNNRVLPDCFSDLWARQGQTAPKKPPRKWKVWWLTVVALYITIRWTGSFMPYYFEHWGLTDADIRLERLVSVFISTFLNSYMMTPLLLFIFDHWLHHIDVEIQNTREPWKTLDTGFTSTWPKVLLTFAFYGGCTMALLVKRR